MANNLIQIKRTSVSGRAANTSTLPNPGELALNMADGILYSTNGSAVFEIGANNTNVRVTGNLTVNSIVANGSVGSSGQVLTSNGSTLYWSTISGSGAGVLDATSQTFTANGTANQFTISQSIGDQDNVIVSVDGLIQVPNTNYTISGTTLAFLTAPIADSLIEIRTLDVVGALANTTLQYTWSNTHTFQNTVTFSQTINGTANNALYLGGTAAAGYQTTAGLSANVATLAANSATYLGGNTASDLRTYTDNKSGNAYSNAVSYVDGKSYVNTSQLSTNLANYQTTAGLSANVATLTANSASFIGTISAANVVTTNSTQTISGAKTFTACTNFSNSVNVQKDFIANGGYGTAGDVLVTAGGGANVYWGTPASANSASFIGTISAANVVTTNSTQTISGAKTFTACTNFTNTVVVQKELVANGGYGSAGQVLVSAGGGANVYWDTISSSVNVAAQYTWTNTHTFQNTITFSSNIVINSVSANGGYGTAGQVLTSNGSTVYWSTASGGGFSNGQSISVNNFVVTGAVTANSSNGTSGQVLTSNGSAVYWSTVNTSSSSNLAITYDTFVANGTQNTFTLSTTESNQNNVLVIINGLVMTPSSDYTISGNTLSTSFIPVSGSEVEVKKLSGSGGGASGVSSSKAFFYGTIMGG